jgi:hypothetical protein
MPKTAYFTVALAAIASLPLLAQPLFAQQGGTSVPPNSPPAVQVPTTSAPAQSTPSSAQQTPPASSPETNSNEATNVDLKPVKGELVKKLDSKDAKVGDSVVVKTEEKVTTANGTEIPKGSKLVGHVALVRAHSKEVQNSQLTLLFDQAQLRDGQTVPIHSTIEAIQPAPGASQQSMADMPGGAAPSGGGAAGGGAMAGGSHGSTGSTGTSASPSAPSPGAGVSASADQSAANGSQAGRVVAGSGATAIRTTDIPNIYLNSNAAGPASGTLFSAKSDVHLDGGTEMVLGVATTGSR